MLLGASLRSVYGGSGERGRLVEAANRRKVATLLGRAPVPFGPPSRFSVRIAGPDQRRAGREAARAGPDAA